jgi:hypothetical protein
VIPEGIVDTLWFEVDERCREFGDEFDEWQDGLGQVALGIREDGMFAATIGGVTISIPRQVAKTFIVMRIVVALCTLYPNLTVIWTAHHLRTSTNTFQKMKSFATSSGVRPYIRNGTNQGTAIRDANGEQEIPFTNGSRILFGSRKMGFGRGFDEVDIEVFDEAQILTEQALEDMVPATNQSRFEFGALLFYMGTPPRPTDPGEVFTSRREEAIELKGDAEDFGAPVVAGDAVYIECSADEDASPDVQAQWAKANPSYPHRTPWQSIQRLRKNLRSIDSQMREGLGVWDPPDTGHDPRSINLTTWDRLAVAPDIATYDKSTARLAVAVAHDRSWTSIVVAGTNSQGFAQLRLIASLPGTDGVAARVDELRKELAEKGNSHPVVALKGDPIADDLVALGVEVDEVGPGDKAKATQKLIDATKLDAPTVRHRGEPALRKSIELAILKTYGRTGVTWAVRPDEGEISPLDAVTMAFGRLGEPVKEEAFVAMVLGGS